MASLVRIAIRVTIAGARFNNPAKTITMLKTFIPLLLTLLVVGTAQAQVVPNVAGCDIRRGTLCTDRNLSGADLKGARLMNSQFTRSKLAGADLRGANLDEHGMRRAGG